MKLDTYYENVSFKLDMFILYKTIFTVLFQKIYIVIRGDFNGKKLILITNYFPFTKVKNI